VQCAQTVLKLKIWVDKNRRRLIERKTQVDADAQETSRASKYCYLTYCYLGGAYDDMFTGFIQILVDRFSTYRGW